MNPLLLPLVAVQGRRARSRIEILPEAAGPTSGSTVDFGEPALRVLVVGESTAAGCGAATHDEAFAGEFARALGELHDRSVRWTVHGRHGATIRRVRHRMIPALDGDVDVAVLLIGVNDVLARTPVVQWRDDLAAVVEALAALAGRVVVAGIPPFDAFPSLPRALGTYLSERGRALDAAAHEVCASDPTVSWMSSTGLAGAEAALFARDGFHPSPAGYRRWAHEIADRLVG
ncbi:MAG TPA: SGNH/GDSL hydrolase family protein [Agromyces sp.]|nr:SGNH/GDSL hydrolase family protein [Agromyces sp.]